MADINTTLGLDLDEAFRDLDRLSDAINRSLGTVEVRLDALSAQRQLDQLAQDADRALSDVDVDIDSAGAARLNDELANAERNLAGADREADQLTGGLRRAERAAADVDTQFGAMRQKIGNVLGALSVAAGVAGAIRLANDARTAFADLQDSVNAVKVVFGEASAPVLQFADDVARTAGLSMAAFNQAASVLGSSLINVGFGADIAAQKTIELTQRAADMASIFGGEVSVAVDAILSALRGESNPIERFGVTLTEAKVQAEAAALGFHEVSGEFDSTAKAAARLEIIMRETDRTAGDFANTAGDLANATKIAEAEFIDAKAALGESLLPVFQALLDAAPEVLGAIEDLAPSLTSLAVSAGNLATSTPGVLDLVDALHLLTDLPRGFGQLGDTINLVFAGIGNNVSAFETLFTEGPLEAVEEFSRGIREAFDQFDQNTIERVNTQGLIDDLREGGDAAQTLANRLADVGKKGKLDPQFIAGLSKIAGVDLQQNVTVLVELIRNADRLGLAADDVTALRIALALLSDQGRPDGPIRSVTDRIREIPEAIPEAVGSFDDLRFAAEEAGLGLADVVLGLDPIAQALAETLTPAERTALVFTAIGEDAGVAAQILAANLRPAIIDVSGALEDLNKDGRVSVTEFIANANAMRVAALQLAVDLSTIAAADTSTAFQLSQLDPQDAAALIADFAGDPAGLKAAAEALFGTPEELGANILEIYVDALGVLQGGNREAIDNFIAFTKNITEKSVPGVTAALKVLFGDALNASFADLAPPPLTPVFVSSVEGMDAGQITAALDEVLFASFADVEPPDLTSQVVGSIDGWSAPTIAEAVNRALFANVVVDLTEQGIAAGGTLMDGISIGVSDPGAIDRLRNDIVDATNTALENRSPSHLMLRMGEAAGDAFWSGFGQANLGPLRTPEVGVTGTATSAVSGAAGGGGIHVELTTINPIQQDAVSDTARQAQIASSIAASYRSVVPNGM